MPSILIFSAGKQVRTHVHRNFKWYRRIFLLKRVHRKWNEMLSPPANTYFHAFMDNPFVEPFECVRKSNFIFQPKQLRLHEAARPRLRPEHWIFHTFQVSRFKREIPAFEPNIPISRFLYKAPDFSSQYFSCFYFDFFNPLTSVFSRFFNQISRLEKKHFLDPPKWYYPTVGDLLVGMYMFLALIIHPFLGKYLH